MDRKGRVHKFPFEMYCLHPLPHYFSTCSVSWYMKNNDWLLCSVINCRKPFLMLPDSILTEPAISRDGMRDIMYTPDKVQSKESTFVDVNSCGGEKLL